MYVYLIISHLINVKNYKQIVQKPRFTNTDLAVGVLCSLTALEILDISDYRKSTPQAHANAENNRRGDDQQQDSDSCRLAVLFVRRMVETKKRLQDLKVLDISGVQANFDINIFRFVISYFDFQY